MVDWPTFLDFSARQAFWTVLVGALCNASCAILGCFLVLRRMSMLGDALSHAVLPGLVIAFILTSSTAPIPMFIGAAVCAVLMAGVSRLLTFLGQTSEESGLGISFTAFFALGILLIQLFAENVHLDRDAVLEGEILHVPLDTMLVWGLDWPVAFWTTGLVLLAVLLAVVLFWKELKVATFDPVYASAIGLHGQAMLGGLVVLVAICVVAAFKIVGSILVVAMLVVPAASAQLVSQRLSLMLVWSVLFSLLSTVAGYFAAHSLNTSAAGMMAVMSGLGYLLALLFSPSQGIVVNHIRTRKLRGQIQQEDLLGILYRCQEHQLEKQPKISAQHEQQIQGIPVQKLQQLAGASYHSQSLQQLLTSGLVVLEDSSQTISLTAKGEQAAEHLIRGHRLWESLLDNDFVLPGDHLHESANQMEHYLDRESHRQIEARLGTPTADPHGRTIPPENSSPDTP